MKTFYIASLFIAGTLLFLGCKKNEVLTNQYGLNVVNEKDLINRAMRLDGQLLDGAMPSPVGAGDLTILDYPVAVQVSAGVVLFIPYSTNNNDTLCNLYLQVEGAESYWEAPVVIDSSSNDPYIQILIPNFVQDGDFNIVYAIADCIGNVSDWVNTNTIVTPPLDCGGSVSGSVGITVTHFDLGDDPGLVVLNYEMFTIRDRIDLRRNNKWIASSGTILSNSQLGPNCSLDGFVSGYHSITFNYDPAEGHDLFVYVTGCDPSTAWDVIVNCPQ